MKNNKMYREAATGLNINSYYGTLAKAEGRQNEFAVSMHIVSAGHKTYKSHITPEEIANMKDDEKIQVCFTINGTRKYRSYTKKTLTEMRFEETLDKFLKSERTAERAKAAKTEKIYKMLYNSAKKLKDEEDAYYDRHAQEHAGAQEQDRILETERLLLRPWQDSDAEDLYRYASDPAVGPIAGWPAHKSIEESKDIIKNVFNGRECFAIYLKSAHAVIGAIELKLNGHTDLTERDDECELGYWLGKPFWGQGIMTEAAKEILRHGFEDAGMTKIWCGYYDGNEKSKRVQEKLGFSYQRTTEGVDVPLMHEKRTGHVNSMTKDEWMKFISKIK